MKGKRLFLCLCGVLVAVDQLTKHMIERKIFQGQSVTVIPGFFNLVHVRNRGAIFGFLSSSSGPWVRVGLLAASLAALVFILYFFVKTPSADIGTLAALTLILTGAVGNQASRLFKGYVVDFIDLHIRNAHWPFFNVADSCITIGAVWLALLFLFKRRHDVSGD